MIDLTFNESDHSYTLNGKPCPSVTQVLSFMDPVYLSETVMEAAERGTAIHRLCNQLDVPHDGAFWDPGPEYPRFGGYCQAWNSFKRQSGFRASLIEVGVAHPTMLYAGRVDRVGYIDTDLTLLDIKSGAKRAVHDLQLAAYIAAFEAGLEDRKQKVKRAGCVYLRENGTYSVEWLKDKGAYSTFLAALNCYRWCQRNGGRL